MPCYPQILEHDFISVRMGINAFEKYTVKTARDDKTVRALFQGKRRNRALTAFSLIVLK